MTTPTMLRSHPVPGTQPDQQKIGHRNGDGSTGGGLHLPVNVNNRTPPPPPPPLVEPTVAGDRA